MTLTVPEAGTTAGRAAQITVPVSDTGAQLAGFGDRMLQIGTAMETERLDRAMQRAGLEITRDLGALRLEFEQMDDPDAIDSQWGPRTAALKASYLTRTDAQGRPAYDRKLADRIDLAFDDMAYRHAFSLGQNAIALRDSQRAAVAFETIEEVKRQGTTSDPEVLDALFDQVDAAARAKHPRNPAAAAEEAARAKADIWNARAIATISADPAGFIADFDAGEFYGLDPERGASLRAQAVAEEARAAAAEVKAGEAAAKARTDAVGSELDRMADGLFAGRNVKGMNLIANPTPQVAEHPGYPRAKAALELFRETPDLATRTVAELDALIAAEAKRPVGGEPWENERLGVLRSRRDKLAADLAADPKAANLDRGVIAPVGSLAFDPADKETFSTGLAEAVSMDTHLRETGRADRPAIFTLPERNALQEVLKPGTDPATRVALAVAILAGTGSAHAAAPVLGALEADPVFRRAVTVLDVTGDEALAEGILRGQSKIDGKTVVMPSRSNIIMVFDAQTGGAFDDAPGLKAELIDATAALYADAAAGIDGETTGQDRSGLNFLADEAAYDLMGRSVQRLLGAQADRDGAFTIGGMQEVNGALTVLPVGVPAETVEEAMDGLVNRLAGGVWDESTGLPGWAFAPPDPAREPAAILREAPGMEARLAPFKAASVYGNVPDLGANPSAMMRTLTLRRVGETGIYELVYEQGGRLFPIAGAGTGRAWRFRLADLIAGVRQ